MSLEHKVPSIIVGYALGIVLVYVGVLYDSKKHSTAREFGQVFTWFFAFQAAAFWILRDFSVPNGSRSYFEAISRIYESGYSWEVINATVPGFSFTNFGASSFMLAESILFGPMARTFIVFHALNIAVGTIAVYVAVDTARVFLGQKASYITLVGFFAYFAWYWTILQGLHEACLFLFLGVAIRAYLKWWETSSGIELTGAIVASVLAIAVSPEQVFALFIIIPLTILFRGRRITGRTLGLAVLSPVLILGAIFAVTAVTGADPYLFINFVRADKAAAEAGLSLEYVPVESVADILMLLPETFRFFLVPILPWQLEIGSQFLRQYAHSLTGFAILSVSMYGFWVLLRGRGRERVSRKSVYALFPGVLGLTLGYSLLESTAGGAVRHSAIFYFVCLVFLFPIGVRALLNRLSRNNGGGSRTSQPSPQES